MIALKKHASRRPQLRLKQRIENEVQPPEHVDWIIPYGQTEETWKSPYKDHPRTCRFESLNHMSEISADYDECTVDISEDQICCKLSFVPLQKPAVKKHPLYLRDDETKIVEGVRVTRVGGGQYDIAFDNISLLNQDEPSETEQRNARNVLKRHTMYLVRLDYVVDPSDFYMEFILDPPDGHNSWDECLQEFYGNPDNARKYKMRTLVVVESQKYVTFNEENWRWERLKVLDSQEFEGTVSGMYLDRVENFEGLPVESLYELHPRFAYWPRYPLHGSLADVLAHPRAGDQEEEAKPGDWSPEAVNYFRNFVQGKMFRAFIVTKKHDVQENVDDRLKHDLFTKVSVLLFEVENEQQIPVNAWLIYNGYGYPTKGMDESLEMMEIFHGVKT